MSKKPKTILDVREKLIKLVKGKNVGDRGADQTEANFTLMIGKQYFNISITETDIDGNDIWEKELINIQGGKRENSSIN